MAFVYWAHLPEHTDMFSQGYIGFTSGTVEKRWSGHLLDSKRCPHLTFYKALAKYGDKIVVETLVQGSSEYCLDVENKLRPKVKIGWNIKIGGDFGSLGVTASEETKKKLSECRLGEKNHFHGKTHTDEQKAKWRISRGGKPFSEDAKAKARETKKNNPWNVSNARKEVWAGADSIYCHFKQGMGLVLLSKLTNISKDSIKTIHKKLQAGWNPLLDTYWVAFKESYNKEQPNVP